VLDSGDEQLILQARKMYWKSYKANYRKQRRLTEGFKECMVTLSSNETQTIDAAARQHRRSRAQFIKKACLAYIRQQYLVPDSCIVGEIRHLLTLNYTAIQQLFNDARISYGNGIELMRLMEALELNILAGLRYPLSVEAYISEVVRKDPLYKDKIVELLKTLAL